MLVSQGVSTRTVTRKTKLMPFGSGADAKVSQWPFYESGRPCTAPAPHPVKPQRRPKHVPKLAGIAFFIWRKYFIGDTRICCLQHLRLTMLGGWWWGCVVIECTVGIDCTLECSASLYVCLPIQRQGDDFSIVLLNLLLNNNLETLHSHSACNGRVGRIYTQNGLHYVALAYFFLNARMLAASPSPSFLLPHPPPCSVEPPPLRTHDASTTNHAILLLKLWPTCRQDSISLTKPNQHERSQSFTSTTCMRSRQVLLRCTSKRVRE